MKGEKMLKLNFDLEPYKIAASSTTLRDRPMNRSSIFSYGPVSTNKGPMLVTPNGTPIASAAPWAKGGYSYGTPQSSGKVTSNSVPQPKPQPQPTNSGGGKRYLTGEELRSMGLNPDQFVSSNGLYDISNLQGGSTSAEEARRQEEERIRGIIESGFNEYENRLRGLIPDYQQSRDRGIESLTKGYESIFQGLQSARDAGLKNLDVSRQQVRANREGAIEDIQKNMRDVIRASQMRLGAIGAGDSSASEVMAPYAFTKLSGEQAGSVYRQANDQLFEIQKQENDTKNLYEQLYVEAEKDKLNKIEEINSKYDILINQIKDRMASAPVEKAQALAQLAQGFAAQRLAELQQIDAENRAIKQRIDEWATNRMAQLNDYKLQLSQSANFNPRDLVYQELNPLGDIGAYRDSQGFLNPLLLKKKQEQ